MHAQLHYLTALRKCNCYTVTPFTDTEKTLQYSPEECTGDGQINGNTRQYRNKGVCVGCTERTLVVTIFLYSFVCWSCVVPVPLQYRLCLLTVHIKVLQNGRPVRFSKRMNCWCMFSWSICKQNVNFIRCIQCSSLQGYVSIYKS
jgi:hypothetical protein